VKIKHLETQLEISYVTTHNIIIFKFQRISARAFEAGLSDAPNFTFKLALATLHNFQIKILRADIMERNQLIDVPKISGRAHSYR
jgi:hypothetical protein